MCVWAPHKGISFPPSTLSAPSVSEIVTEGEKGPFNSTKPPPPFNIIIIYIYIYIYILNNYFLSIIESLIF